MKSPNPFSKILDIAKHLGKRLSEYPKYEELITNDIASLYVSLVNIIDAGYFYTPSITDEILQNAVLAKKSINECLEKMRMIFKKSDAKNATIILNLATLTFTYQEINKLISRKTDKGRIHFINF